MADRAKKVSELTSLTAASGDDLLLIVDDPSGTPATKNITVNSLFADRSIANTTFANVTVTDTATIATAEITTSNTNIGTFANVTVTDTATIATAEITTSNTSIGTFVNITVTDTITADIGAFANVTATNTTTTDTLNVNNSATIQSASLNGTSTIQNAQIADASISNQIDINKLLLNDNYTPESNPMSSNLLRILGNMFWDEDYLYFVYKDNHIKRIALESFFFLTQNLHINSQNFFAPHNISTN